ncbi:MAG TPA: hypothetical protein VH189_16515, partial [Rhizomicrobium sp.]|nr:hypothetical protein [Rhizomicrobium sp.]
MRICVPVLAAGAVAVLAACVSAKAQLAPVGPAAPTAQQGQFALQAESPKFWNLVDKNASLQKVTSGFSFTEGPVWDEKAGVLYVSDEDQNRVARVAPDGRV